jgi:hypothetical protein
VAAGGEVHWTRQAGAIHSHSVHQDDGLFDSGDPTAGPIDFTVDFSAGTFHYYCEVHGSPTGGMDGVVRVPVRINVAPTGRPFTVRWATQDTQTGSIFDVQYKVGSGEWRNWKVDTSKLKAVFGKNGNPVVVKAGVKYSFRARSQEGSATSKYSPKKSFTL